MEIYFQFLVIMTKVCYKHLYIGVTMYFCVRIFLEGEQMRLKEGFLLRKVAGEYVVVPSGNAMVDFKVMISLNETGAFLWEALKEEKSESDLVAALLGEYDVDEKVAAEDVGEFVNLLKEKNLLV